MTHDRRQMMEELERQVAAGRLRWLADEHGYAIWSSAWPTLELRAMWTVVELGFGEGPAGRLELGCRLGAVGHPGTLTPRALAQELGLEVDVDAVPVPGPEGVAPACERLSALLGGPLRAVVEGDLGAFGVRAGHNSRHAESGERPPDELEASLSEADRTALLAGLEGGLREQAGWLWEELGFAVAERAWPHLRLASPRAGLRLSYYGLNHGAPPPAVALALEDPLDGDLPAYELDDLLSPEPRLDTPLVVRDPRQAGRSLAARLVVLRPLLAGEEPAWRSLRRERAELGARRGLQDDLRRSVPRADRAFREGDLAAVVDLLEGLDGLLPRAAQLKLDYARRRRRQG